jgi:hypothetical protein
LQWGGVVTVIYEEVFHKQVYRFNRKPHDIGVIVFMSLPLLLTAALFSYFKYTSFWSITIAMILTSICLMILRKDLFVAALSKGILMMLASLPVYYTMISLSPNWVNRTYMFQTLSGIKVTGIPIEELVFWFLFGFYIGPLYEYWQSERLRNIPKRNRIKAA